MHIYKCPRCGAELNLPENKNDYVAYCEHCDSKVALPKNLEKVSNLLNRATYLRQNSEFDKALATYEDVLKEDSECAEAYYGMLLSRYGIEYVTDPATKHMKPTCHRLLKGSVFQDSDYQKAVELSDYDKKILYEEQAGELEKIRSILYELSQKEEKYDVFICYKESNNGDRTEDSIIAQEIYEELIKHGYRVFFARKTLTERLGVEYEPIIYTALNSAKIMVLVTTNTDYLNAVWVKNEWKRFLELKKSGKELYIVPMYKNISPYDLPMELSSLQGIDVSKLGYMQDIREYAEKVIKKTSRNGGNRSAVNHSETKSSVVNSVSQFDLEDLIKKIETFLGLGEYDQVYTLSRTVINHAPDNCLGWYYKARGRSREFSSIAYSEETISALANAKNLSEGELHNQIKGHYDRYSQWCQRQINREQKLADLNRKEHEIREHISASTALLKKKKQMVIEAPIRRAVGWKESMKILLKFWWLVGLQLFFWSSLPGSKPEDATLYDAFVVISVFSIPAAILAIMIISRHKKMVKKTEADYKVQYNNYTFAYNEAKAAESTAEKYRKEYSNIQNEIASVKNQMDNDTVN